MCCRVERNIEEGGSLTHQLSALRAADKSSMKVESSGSGEVENIAKGPPAPMKRSKRRGSVLRREVLGRLRQGKNGPTQDEDGGGLLDGGRRGVPGGETLNSSCDTTVVWARCLMSKYRPQAVVFEMNMLGQYQASCYGTHCSGFCGGVLPGLTEVGVQARPNDDQ